LARSGPAAWPHRALTALELLVAFLQAYVFAILTCIYLNDAIHPGH
jgi:F0F1-type ATP synthase, subunit a